MRLMRVIPATLMAGVVGLTGVGTAAAAPTAGQHYKITVTNPKSGSQVEIPDGDRLLLRLTACESCGYRWKVTKKPDATVVAFDKQLSSTTSCQSPCTGGNATERFRFLSKGVGDTSVVLGYFPPGKTRPAKTLRLRLTVVA